MNVLEIFGIKKLKEEFNELQKKYNLLKVDFDNKNQEVNKIRIEKIKLFNDIQNKNTEIAVLENKIKELEKEIDKKNIQIQDLTIKIENLNWKNKEKENKILLEKKYIESLEKENNICREIYIKQVRGLKEELTTFKKLHKELENNSKSLESECLEEKKKNIKILEELEEYKGKLAKIEEKVNKVQESKQENKEKEEINPIKISSIEEKDIQIESLEEKKVQEKLKTKIASVEKIIKRQNFSSLKWDNYEEFIKNENNLTEYLKSFLSEDFQNIYFQVKKRGIIKKVQEKFFTNILIRMRQRLPITNIDIEKIELLYKELMKQLLKENKDNQSEFKDKKIVREKNIKDEKIDEEIMNILF